MTLVQRLLVLLLLGSLSACVTYRNNLNGKVVESQPFEFKSLAKSNIDLVGETHQRMFFADLKILADKLYKRNPREWKKANHATEQDALKALFREPYPRPDGKHSIDCIRLSFDEAYQGDRVEAFIAGIATMIMDAYENKHDFYILDSLDAQKLYNSARNIEVAAWMLRSKLDSKNQPFLQSAAGEGNEINLSFERIFGRLIANQDSIAQVTADRTHRAIKGTLQTVMMAFIPL